MLVGLLGLFGELLRVGSLARTAGAAEELAAFAIAGSIVAGINASLIYIPQLPHVFARCEASRSAKNGSRSPMACTAWVASRPEYCLSRRSVDSGTSASSSIGDRGRASCILSGISKSYAIFWTYSTKTPCRGGAV